MIIILNPQVDPTRQGDAQDRGRLHGDGRPLHLRKALRRQRRRLQARERAGLPLMRFCQVTSD